MRGAAALVLALSVVILASPVSAARTTGEDTQTRIPVLPGPATVLTSSQTTHGLAARETAGPRLGDVAEILQQVGLEEAGKAFVDINAWGTPDEIIAKFQHRRECIGDFDLITICSSFGSFPPAQAEASIRLFGEKVLPVVQSWR